MAEITEYDKYNTLAAEVGGPDKPKPTPKPKTPAPNKYEALRQSGVETSVIGRDSNDVTPYDKGAVAGENTAETRAYKQSPYEKYMSGALKGTGLAGTTVASTFTSLPYGILKASYQGAFDDTKSKSEAFSSVYDNEISTALDEFNKNMEKWLPNYYSEKEQKAEAFDADNILSANFWGDKVLKNTGFTIGAIFGGAKVAKGFQYLGKLATGGRYAQELAAMNALVSGGMKPAEAMAKVASGIRAVDALTSLGASTIAAAGEGSMEAKQVKDELKQNLLDEYKASTGSSIVPPSIVDTIERTASSAGNTTFAANMAILTASDYFQFGKLFYKGFKQEATRVGKLALEDGIYSAIKPTFKSKVASMLKSGLSNGLIESAEEGSQTFTQTAAKDYYTRQFDKNGLATKDDMLHSMVAGLSDTFESKEGLESMLLGAVTGVGSHAATSAISKFTSKNQPDEYNLTSKAAVAINAANKRLQPFMDSIVRGDSITKDKEAILRSNNPSKFLFGNIAHDEFKNIVQPYLETNKFDILEDRLNSQLNREDITDWGTDSSKNSREYVSNLLTEAKRIKDSWDVVNTRFPSADYNAKVALWDSMTNIENSDNRAKELEAKIARDSGVSYTVVTGAGKDFLTEVQKAIDNGAVKTDINDAKDLERLVNQKKDLVNKYKRLLSPEEQAKVVDHVKKAISDAEKTESPKVEDKTVEPIIETPEQTSTTEASNPIVDTEIVAPKASNEQAEPDLLAEDVKTIQASIDKGENSVDDILSILDDQAKDLDGEDLDHINAIKSAILENNKVEEKVEDVKQEPKSTIEEDAQDLYSQLKDSIDKGEQSTEDVVAWLDDNLSDAEGEDKAIGERVRELLTSIIPKTFKDAGVTESVLDREEGKKNEAKIASVIHNLAKGTIIKSDTSDDFYVVGETINSKNGNKTTIVYPYGRDEKGRLIQGKPLVVETKANGKSSSEFNPFEPYSKEDGSRGVDSYEVSNEIFDINSEPVYVQKEDGSGLIQINEVDIEEPEEGPTISENDDVHSDYSEMDKMSDTAFRSTSNHEEAIKDGVWSIVRYQNFINNPSTNTQGLRLKVITKSDPLYSKLLNKKQRAFEEKRAAEGKEINGILAIVVNSKDDIIMTDTSGTIIDNGYEEGDVDNELSGPLVTTLVSNANKKDSNFNAVSYQHFGRTNGFGNKITEQEAMDPTTPVGKLWKEHVDKLANDRASMLKGDIKYLSITGISNGVFQDTNQSNEVGETLGIDVNSDKLSFIVPKIEDIDNPGKTTIGLAEGLTKEQTVKVGKPYLIYNGKLFPLRSRKLNATEIDNVVSMVELMNANPSREKYFLSKIKELVFINKQTLKSVIDGTLSGDDLREYLSTKYRQIDAKLLETNPEGNYEISFITEKGVNTKKNKQSYRDYVLVGNNRALSVNYSPHPTTVNDSPNYLNGYITYNPIEDIQSTKLEISSEPISVEQVVKEVTTKALSATDKKAKLAKLRSLASEEEDNSSLKRRITLQSGNKKENISEAKKWFEDRFNGESFEVVDNLINGNAFGEYTAAATRLYSGAEEGTIYHEAFHKVTQEYLTPKEVESLYNSVRKTVIGASKYTDLEAEEWLAEEFRKFVLTNKSVKQQPLINRVFRRLYNWIKSLVTGKTTPEQIFERLAGKGYTGAKKFNNQQFTKLERAIPGLTHQQTKNIIDSVNGHFFRRLFAANLTPDEILGSKGREYIDKIYSRVYQSLINDYTRETQYWADDIHSDEEYEAIEQHYKLMLDVDSEGEPTGLNAVVIQAHKDYLKSIGIDIAAKIGLEDSASDEDNDSDNAEVNNADNDDRSRDTAYDKSANEESSIHSAPNSIKLLVMSLPQVDSDGEAIFNDIGGPKLNDYLQSMKLLYSNLAGLSSFEDMYTKIQDISGRFPVFRQLLTRLGEPGSNKSLEQFLLEQDFRQAFSKFESKGTITLINPETGSIYQVDANANKLKDRIKENWISNLRALSNDSSSYVKKNDEGILQIDPLFVSDARAGKFKDNSKLLLHNLGIDFTDLTQEQVQAIPDIKNTVNTLFKYLAVAIEEGKAINDLFSKDADIKGQLNKLVDIEAPLSKEVVELSYISAEGKRIYAVSLNHYYSLTVNNINNAKSKDELFTKYPHLNNPYTQNSIWLKNLFDKNGVKIPGQKLFVNTVSGLKIQNDNDSGIGATKMEPSDKIVQEINDLLGYGTVSLIRAADKSSEYALGITNYGTNHLAIPLETIQKEGLANSKTHEIFFGYFNDELSRIRSFEGLKDKNDEWIRKPVGKNFAIYNKQAMNFSLFADILSADTLSSIEPYKSNDEEIDALLEAKISKEITEYLESYAADVKQYMNDRKIGLVDSKGFSGINPEFTKEGLDPAIQTFVANHLINMIEQSKLLIGDSAFYKDKIKRISAGTGTKKFAASSKLVDNWLNNFYKTATNKRVDGKIANGRVKTVIFDDVKAKLDIFDDYVDALEKSGMSRAEAEKVLDAYTSMDEGDAQGWITLDEYREFFIRVGGAYWTEQHEKQYQYEKALENGEEGLTNPNFYFMPIKAQHFGPQKADNIYAPAFHKYSLAPLYHSLVKGRNMEKLLDSMRKNQVGYALFGSGSKVGTPVDNSGKLPAFYNSDSEINGINDNTPIQEIYYENLGIQLDIAPKVKESLIFGSQARKLLFSNLFGENVKAEFKQLATEYNKIIDDLVKYEFNKLTKKLGIKIGPNGELGFNGDYKKLVTQLRDNLEDKDTADNILDSLQTNEDGSLKYPIDSMVNRPKIESMLFSIVNSKVIKQKMNGNSLVQLASSGFEEAGKREVGSSNYLAFYTNKGENGTTTAMEVEIPMNKNYQPLLDKYKTIDKLNEAIVNGEVDSKHLSMIGYRIPTQGLNSMDVMTIKRFMPEASGIAIILPTGVVAKSGGDYDIDKLNIFMPNLFFDEKNNYVGSHTLTSSTKTDDYKKASQNKIIDIMSQVLTHPDNFIDLTTPNTTDTLTNLVGKIREAQGQSTKIEKASMTKEFRFDFIMEQFTYFLGGKAALGIAATHNTHHILSQIAKVKLNASIPFKHNNDNGQVDLSRITTQAGQKISDLISQFINAYVDVAKDPFYKDLNAGTEVTSVWMYLLRAGVDVNTIGYFMTQPIIKEYVAARKLNKSLVNSNNKQAEFKADLSETGIQKIKDKMAMSTDDKYISRMQNLLDNGSIYNDMLKKYGNSNGKYTAQSFNGNNANKRLLAMISGETNRDAQTYLLEKFVEIEKQAGELTTLMQDTNNDTTKLQNYGSIYKRELTNQKVNDSEIIPTGTSEKIKKDTIVGSFDISDKISRMYSELTLYTKYPAIKQTINKLLSEIDTGKDFAKEYTRIQNDFIGYMTQKFGKTIEGQPLWSKINLLSGDNSLAKQLVALRRDEIITNNPLFDELVAIISGNTKSIDNVKLYSRRMGAFESNVFTEAFRELLESNNPKVSEFGRNLAYITILQSGLQNSPITFTELIPFEFYGEIVNGAIKQVDKLDIDDFIRGYYHNQSSGSFKLQDYGITDSPTNTKVVEELPQQNDNVVDTGSETEEPNILDPTQQEQFDSNQKPFEGAKDLVNKPIDIVGDIIDTRTGEVYFTRPKIGAQQNSIREINSISNRLEEKDVNKQCNI